MVCEVHRCCCFLREDLKVVAVLVCCSRCDVRDPVCGLPNTCRRNQEELLSSRFVAVVAATAVDQQSKKSLIEWRHAFQILIHFHASRVTNEIRTSFGRDIVATSSQCRHFRKKFYRYYFRFLCSHWLMFHFQCCCCCWIDYYCCFRKNPSIRRSLRHRIQRMIRGKMQRIRFQNILLLLRRDPPFLDAWVLFRKTFPQKDSALLKRKMKMLYIHM